jgi:hypothetical protein
VIEVIEINPAHRQVAKLLDGCGRLHVRENGRLRLEGERNEASEPAGFILHLPQLAEVVDALLERLDMPVEHGAGAAATHLVPDPMDIEPFGGAFLAAAKLVADVGIEDLCAPTGKRAQTSVPKSSEGVGDRELEDTLGQMANLDRCEGFDDQVWVESAHSLEQFDVPLLFQSGVQPADHVNLSNAGSQRFFDSRGNVIYRTLKGVGIPLLRRKGAKLTRENAQIRVVDVAIEDVGGDVAILLLAKRAGHNAEGI